MAPEEEIIAMAAYVEWRSKHQHAFMPAQWNDLGDGWRDAFVAVARFALEAGKRTVIPEGFRLRRKSGTARRG